MPGTAAPVLQNFPDAAGSTCGMLLPTDNPVDAIDGVEVTCIDNGMPVVVLRASDLGVTGYESREDLEANGALGERLESIRLQAGPLMSLGDVGEKSVPKMTLAAPPRAGGAIATRTFIPHRCHASIGVLGAVSVATACMLPGSIAHALARVPDGVEKLVSVEHPSGETSVMMRVAMEGRRARDLQGRGPAHGAQAVRGPGVPAFRPARTAHRGASEDTDLINPTLASQAFCALAALNAARVLDVLYQLA